MVFPPALGPDITSEVAVAFNSMLFPIIFDVCEEDGREDKESA